MPITDPHTCRPRDHWDGCDCPEPGPDPSQAYVGRCHEHGLLTITGIQLREHGYTCPECGAALEDVRD